MFFYRNKRYIPFLIIFVIFLFHAFNNYIILAKDNIPVIHDELQYFMESGRWYGMFNDIFFKWDFSNALLLFKNWASPYPPLVQITSALFYFPFGLTEDMAVLSLLPYLFILFFSVYMIGRKLYNNLVGLLAAFLISIFPMIISFSRVYYLEIPVTALSSLALLVLLNTDYFSNRKYSVLFGITLAMALLAKWISIVFIAGPFGLCIFSALFSKTVPKKKIIINLFISLCVCFLFILPVYSLLYKTFLSNYSSVFINSSKYNLVNLNIDSFFIYFKHLYNFQILSFFTIVFCCSILIFLLKTKNGKGFLIIWFLFPCIFFTALYFLGYFESPRFTVPCLPSVALIISSAVFSLNKDKKVKFSSVIVVLIIALLVVVGLEQFFRLSYDSEYRPHLLSSVRYHHGFGRYQAYVEDWKTKELIAIIKNKRLSKKNGKTIVLPFHTAGILHTPLKRAFWFGNILYDDFLNGVSGGYLGLQGEEIYENKIRKADIIIIKYDGFLSGVGGDGPIASQVYKILLKLFEKNKDLFYLADSFDLPDNSKLLVYVKK